MKFNRSSASIETEQRILDYIKDYTGECGYPPTIREIGRKFQLKSTSSVIAHLRNMEKADLIRRNSKIPRGIEIVNKHNGWTYGNPPEDGRQYLVCVRTAPNKVQIFEHQSDIYAWMSLPEAAPMPEE